MKMYSKTACTRLREWDSHKAYRATYFAIRYGKNLLETSSIIDPQHSIFCEQYATVARFGF